jgi:hypothetical protein
MDIKKALSEIDINIAGIGDEKLKAAFLSLLNIIEASVEEIKALKEENQNLRDENNRLKGENGKPEIRKQSKKENKDISSEEERKQKKQKKDKINKTKEVKIDRVETREIDRSELPQDAIFKGYSTVVVQDIHIITDNVEFMKEVYYSPSLKKTFVADLPEGYEGEFGPNVKSLIISLYHEANMTELKIAEFLTTHGIIISPSTISRFLIKKHESFHKEKEDIVLAGLESSTYQQMDDTGARVDGKNYYTHVLCNSFYTAYFTRKHKNRLTILEILSQGNLMFCFNESSYSLMEQMNLPSKTLSALKKQNLKSVMSRIEVDKLLKILFPCDDKHKTNKQTILEASAITFYQSLPNAIRILLTDDAPQFKQITELLALCWIHDGRLYKKLDPVVELHIQQLKNFLGKYWSYYHKLLAYKDTPSKKVASELTTEFDELFSTRTGYDKLDDRIEKTRLKKDSLLLVLEHPQLPLHNNGSELGARSQARRRDVSFQTKNDDGTDAKDTFMTIVETAKKLGVNTYDYILDRISKKFKMPSLAELIKNLSADLIYNTS